MVIASNISENLLNEIRQIMHSLERMNKKQFLLCKKLFGHINHHQLLNEYGLHNVFAFYQTLLIIKSNKKKKTEKEKKCTSFYSLYRAKRITKKYITI